jgi:hypothetical protein
MCFIGMCNFFKVFLIERNGGSINVSKTKLLIYIILVMKMKRIEKFG